VHSQAVLQRAVRYRRAVHPLAWVLAAHFTPLGGRLGLVAQTVETVRFTRPERVDFRLVRGPVSHVVEAFVLTEQAGGAGTRLAYDGEIGADLWLLGQRWCELGCAALGVDGRGLAGCGQGRSRTTRVERRGTPTPPAPTSYPNHRLTARDRRPHSKKPW
jgi:hypothetical protein